MKRYSAYHEEEVIRRLKGGEALSYLGIVVTRKRGIARPDRPSLHISETHARKLCKELGLIPIKTENGKAFVLPRESK